MREHLKAIPKGDLIAFEMDRDGFDLLSRIVARSEPRGTDNPKAHKQVKDRIEGALLAARSQMGWPQ
ncbi:hypothetical protein [Yoonia sp.]|uniref:hypothetical protein n=1 Tax=Yoonia sp. TaxID=2212373 RepID=UPI002DFC4E4A|nr:hypothetical protein [Yoonia sp.]